MTEVTEVLVKRYRCPHCRRTWSKKKTAQAHINRRCIKAPDSHACATCEHQDSNWACEKDLKPADAVVVLGCTGWKECTQ